MQFIQQLAATILGQVLSGRNLNQQLSNMLRDNNALSAQERGALQDLSYGTLRYYGLLTHILDDLLSNPISDTRIRNLLLVALYQLQFTKAAHHAVVDYAVRASKHWNAATGGLVNAVLRNFLRRRDALIRAAEASDVGRFSYAQWWIDFIRAQYGDLAESILQAGNQHPPMTLRVNQRLYLVENYVEQLRAQQMPVEVVYPNAVRLRAPIAVEKLPGFFAGAVSVQDAGAQYAARLLDAVEGMRVLDACAAPGGKTAHLLEMQALKLTAVDKDALRLQRVRENLQRLNLAATLVCGDAADPSCWWDGKPFDRILADVPCSASGVVRRHPDIKWLRRPADIEHFALQQEQILAALWPLLGRGGKLLYVTCSVFDRENRQVIENFVSGHADAVQEKLSAPDMHHGQLLPNDQHDGFFYALLHKSA